MVVFWKMWLHSCKVGVVGKSGCIREKVVVFGECGCILAKVVIFEKTG